MKLKTQLKNILIAPFILFFLSSCGGGGSSGSAGDAEVSEYVAPEFAISGQLTATSTQLARFKPFEFSWSSLASVFISSADAAITGLVAVPDATLNLFKVDDNGLQVGEVLATTTSDSEGNFNLLLPEGVSYASNLVLQAQGEDSEYLTAFVVKQEVNINPLSQFIFSQLIANTEINITQVSSDGLSEMIDEVEDYAEANSIDLTPFTTVDSAVQVFEQDSSLQTLVEDEEVVLLTTSNRTVPEEFSIDWLADRTFYVVYFGFGEDESNSDKLSAGVSRFDFAENGSSFSISPIVGGGEQRVAASLSVSNGLLQEGSDIFDGSRLVCGSTEDYLKVHYIEGGSYYETSLWFYDLEDALEYASTLTDDISPCTTALDEETILEIPQASITVDGNIQDWAGINPVKTDPTGDQNGSSSADLVSLRAAFDQQNFYILYEVNGSLDLDLFNYDFFVHLNSDADCKNDLYSLFGGLNWGQSEATNGQSVSKEFGRLSPGGDSFVSFQGEVSYQGNYIEFSMPLSEFDMSVQALDFTAWIVLTGTTNAYDDTDNTSKVCFPFSFQ